MKSKYISLFELRESCKPIIEKEESRRRENIANFLRALAPKNYPKAETA